MNTWSAQAISLTRVQEELKPVNWLREITSINSRKVKSILESDDLIAFFSTFNKMSEKLAKVNLDKFLSFISAIPRYYWIRDYKFHFCFKDVHVNQNDLYEQNKLKIELHEFYLLLENFLGDNQEKSSIKLHKHKIDSESWHLGEEYINFPFIFDWHEIWFFSINKNKENINKEIINTISQQIMTFTKIKLWEAYHKKLSKTDWLTWLPNRRDLISKLKIEIAKAQREKIWYVSVCMIDADNFKEVNDIFWHIEGDRVLIKTADILTKTIRPGDIAWRLWWEEFLIILSHKDFDDAKTVSERIRKKFEKEDFKLSCNWNVREKVTVSIWVNTISWNKLNEDSIETYIKEADFALYRAKDWWRNKVVLFNNEKL